jgi:hypothetical protein
VALSPTVFALSVTVAFSIFSLATLNPLFVALGALASSYTQADIFVSRRCFFVIWGLARAWGRVKDRLGDRWRQRGFVGE